MKQHELYASIRVELPEMPQQLAGVVADITKAWAAMLADIGIEVEAHLSISEVRPKRGPTKPRKPRLVPPSLDEAQGILKATA